MAPVKKPKPVLGQTYLRHWREHKGIGQQTAADSINVSRGLLSKMENATSPYLQQHLEGLAKLYGCKPADLLGTDPQATAVPASPKITLRSALIAYGIDSDDLPAVFKAIKGFLGEIDDEQSQQDHPHDQSEPANLHRAK
ncbi:helix-turn-helix domain-containing protein [Ensifer sp. PDNC004]|uniref:helix-turn-helix domain-containing protein n=1 Tax=Ensifer sp. PDNC004 TaxID=2811423 RepID=UPI0019652E3C|nr:helix-turn-helix transcriptional regulator [Ensifer sp. PDNC004]QRY69141.1 helix-turn-helix domain-containing protein [Ensifer sp. PDNC004]